MKKQLLTKKQISDILSNVPEFFAKLKSRDFRKLLIASLRELKANESQSKSPKGS